MPAGYDSGLRSALTGYVAKSRGETPANPTSNALYQRIGYVPVTDFTDYDFSYDAPEAG
jgi:hypothetical protein